ncbi:MAG: UDP-N-acetylglucosamine acyltransferase [Actinobacteria bacterium]|nr:UDP-N-acetylglucosamine acyltransferase [Actinomycetota bacterium]
MGNRIHPTAVVGDAVHLGDGNVVGPYAVLLGPCRIGDNNWIGPHATLGAPAERRAGPHPAAWDGELAGTELLGTGVEIGCDNVIREYVSVHQGSVAGPTRLGDGGYLMTGSHLGHDSVVGDGVTIASAVQIAGGCHVWAWVSLGLGAVVHQDTVVGPGAMIGMGSPVRGVVDPFSLVVGNPARKAGFNTVGLTRRGCSEELIPALEAYLRGRAELPAGLPEEVALMLQTWERAQAARR